MGRENVLPHLLSSGSVFAAFRDGSGMFCVGVAVQESWSLPLASHVGAATNGVNWNGARSNAANSVFLLSSADLKDLGRGSREG